MSKIPEFDKFNEAIVAAGFGQMGINNFALGGATPQTGYSMTPIAGVVESCSNHVAEQANMYEDNDNDDHTAESYMKEAKDHINESMDRAYESYKATNEELSGHAKKMKEDGLSDEEIKKMHPEVTDKDLSEAMVQIAGKDKPSGAKVLASVIVDHLMDKKIVTRAAERKLTAEIQDLIIKSTF